MTGLPFLPTAPEEGPDQHGRNFRGVPRILGPKWAQLPTITIGMLGVSILWSVEMSYGVWALTTDYVNNFFCSWHVSFALLTFPGTIQVKHGWCLRCRTPFWTYRATVNRRAMHTFLFIKTSPDLTIRCIGGQLYFKIWPPKTLYVARNSHLLVCNAFTWIHQTSRLHIHGIG